MFKIEIHIAWIGISFGAIYFGLVSYLVIYDFRQECEIMDDP